MATDSHQPGCWVGGLKDVSYLCLSHDFALAFFGVTGGAGFQTSIGILRELVGAG